MASREFDLVLYGVSGFTGKLAARYLVSTYGAPKSRVSYALAGRNRTTVEEVVSKIEDENSLRRGSIPIVVVALEDAAAVASMCRRATSIASLVGPYSEVGEPIMKGCVESGTNYVDITGEIDWVATMRDKYDDEAKKKRIKILPCSGFDYIPMEMCMMYLESVSKNFESHKNVPMDVIQVCKAKSMQPSGGTMRSMLRMMENMTVKELQEMRLNTHSMCKHGPPSKNINADMVGLRYVEELSLWALPFPMSPGMLRYILWANESRNYAWGRELKYAGACTATTLVGAICRFAMIFAFTLFMVLTTRFSVGTRLVKSIVRWWGEGPDVEGECALAVITVAKFEPKLAKDATKTVMVSYKYDKGEAYRMTGMSVIETALCCSLESENPANYGVTTPGWALGQSLMTRLQKAGVEFELEG